MRAPSLHPPDSRAAGGLLCAAGLALVCLPARFAPALGLELLAAGFWWWARAAEEPALQVSRWSWLRRPATALWLAAAVQAVLDAPAGAVVPEYTFGFWWRVAAVATVWAALELLAALPLARPFSDLPAPVAHHGSWLPVLLPVAGFLLLWRQARAWVDVDEVRDLTALLLLLTAVLAALRAFGRRRWTAGLRWLVVCDCALAAVLLAGRAVPPWIVALLWTGACGTHAFLLAAELAGAAPRRGPLPSMLWRATAWVSTAALSGPLLVTGGNLPPPRAVLVVALGGAAVLLASWVNVAHIVEAPERRAVTRPGWGLSLHHLVPALLLAGVPVALLGFLWTGLAPRWEGVLTALAPALLGGGAGLLTFRGGTGASPGAGLDEVPATPAPWFRPGQVARRLARRMFLLVVGLERALVSWVIRLLRLLGTPLRDLHMGDAQEYVLFLVGVAVLALLLPLLR